MATMTKLEKGKAMQCLGKMVHYTEADPDPKAQEKLQEEYNCKNCNYRPYCCDLAETL